MKIPLMDLAVQYRTLQGEIEEAIHKVLDSGQFVLGANVAMLEEEIASYLGVKHAVGVASGTDALVLSLRALNIGPGDEVIVPAYTFFATAGAVLLVGATPVFVDINDHTYCLDVERVAKNITSRTKAVIPVHLYGHPADMTNLREVVRPFGLKVIEDNAQALGAEWDGRKTGGIGDVGCLSFFPSKNLGAFGDGGMVVTDDSEAADKVRMLRTHGWRIKYYPETLGYNSRLDELQAAILRIKLRHLDEWNKQRRYLAGLYRGRLYGLGIGVPYEHPNAKHIYHLYMIRVKARDGIQRFLKDAGIASAIYYPQPLHLMQPCRHLGFKEGDFPRAELASKETLAIPLYPEMSSAQLEAVSDSLSAATERIL